jgi:capsular polysaccharide export protein
MKRVVAYIDWPDRLRFFQCVAQGLKARGIQTVFLTNKLSLHRRASKCGAQSVLMRNTAGVADLELGDTRECLGGVLSSYEANRLYAAAMDSLAGISARFGPPDALFIWNGSGVAGRALDDFGRQNSIERLFFEISNLPGKLFVDGGGVNARSWLAQDAALLDSFAADRAEFEAWLARYLEQKRVGGKLPQAAILDQVSYLETLLNRLAFTFLSVPTDDYRSLVGKVMQSKKRKNMRLQNLLLEPDVPYVLFPMQVANDSQILLNSDVNNLDAVRWAADFAASKGAKLVVKPHPAESDAGEIERLSALSAELGFRFSVEETVKLIERAEAVVTINSTVGLEAILTGKPVEFLGRTFYHHLSDRTRLASYVMSYLFDIDYFSDQPIPQAQIDRLITRAEFNRRYREQRSDG